MDQQTSNRIDKVVAAIQNMPTTPKSKICWIVYNDDMVEYTKTMISDIKGKEYLDKYVIVVAKGALAPKVPHTVYFDPGLQDLIGNGRT